MMIPKDDIRREFLDAGFTVKPGEPDLKPYVYEAATRLIALAESAERERIKGIVAERALNAVKCAGGTPEIATACYALTCSILAAIDGYTTPETPDPQRGLC
jgi:hypothetical protein